MNSMELLKLPTHGVRAGSTLRSKYKVINTEDSRHSITVLTRDGYGYIETPRFESDLQNHCWYLELVYIIIYICVVLIERGYFCPVIKHISKTKLH